MPIQAPQWTDYLNCPVCCREFGAPPRSPISLSCGHTLCRHCLKHLHRKQCPFDQTAIQLEPEELVVNTALLQLAGYSPPAQPYHPPCIQLLPEKDRQAYDVIVRCMEHLAVYLKYCGNANNSMAGSRLSRPMQRKLVTLLQCAMIDEEGRGRAARAARSLGERTVTELILQHQNPQQLSANLWAAVRARGCQFLGPAMQEEVLKLVLLALEDGSALSRKVLVMFVVQRLEPHFPQASKTSIGHVVQLLYRASCFKVSKRECDSSLMQLKEEFRTYESLRREHDAQIVQIATEAGLRIAPDQWSALLYGDTAHKSHMQSIIDKLQTPQSFAQSVQELFIALQRTGDPAQLVVMSLHLDRLANIDASPEAKSPSWQQLAELMTSLKEVVSGLIHYLQQQTGARDANHNAKHDRCQDPTTSQSTSQSAVTTPTHKYKMSMCRDATSRAYCPRGNSCAYGHPDDELERVRMISSNGHYGFISGVGSVGGVPTVTNMMPPPGSGVPSMSGVGGVPVVSGIHGGGVPLNNGPGMASTNSVSGGLGNVNNLPSGIPNVSSVPSGMPNNVSGGMQSMPQPIQLVPQLFNPYPMQPQSQPQPIGQSIVQHMDTYNSQSVQHIQTVMSEPPPESMDVQSSYSSGIIHAPQGIYDPNNTNYNYNVGFRRIEYSPVYPVAEPVPVQVPVPSVYVPVTRNVSRFSYDEPIQEEMREALKAATFTPISSDHESSAWGIGGVKRIHGGSDVYAYDNAFESLPVRAHCSESIDGLYTCDRRAVGTERSITATSRSSSEVAEDQQLEKELEALERRIDTEFKSTD
ncbi:roquin-1 isoform X2 [Manduca sexta]|uniref:roquin-1 isoform X2 n=1 Tax=Manduca sexta TaxID=7130 RepID=UPI00188EEC3C|nr:roquin-1 isoform X2 [Manduca sexta]